MEHARKVSQCVTCKKRSMNIFCGIWAIEQKKTWQKTIKKQIEMLEENTPKNVNFSTPTRQAVGIGGFLVNLFDVHQENPWGNGIQFEASHILGGGCPPSQDAIVANEGLGKKSPILKMGGDWNPGRGDNPKHMLQNGLVQPTTTSPFDASRC